MIDHWNLSCSEHCGPILVLCDNEWTSKCLESAMKRSKVREKESMASVREGTKYGEIPVNKACVWIHQSEVVNKLDSVSSLCHCVSEVLIPDFIDTLLFHLLWITRLLALASRGIIAKPDLRSWGYQTLTLCYTHCNGSCFQSFCIIHILDFNCYNQIIRYSDSLWKQQIDDCDQW